MSQFAENPGVPGERPLLAGVENSEAPAERPLPAGVENSEAPAERPLLAGVENSGAPAERPLLARMENPPLRYAITDRTRFADSEAEQQRQAALVRNVARWAVEGLEFIQLREKDLAAGALAALARRMLVVLGTRQPAPRLLVNSRADVAIAVAAAGVHLTSAAGELTPRPAPPTLRRGGAAAADRQRLLPHPGRRCPRARLRRKPHPLRSRL